MNRTKISFVLPIKINTYGKGSDLDRAAMILMPSLVKYFDLKAIDQFLVMVPENDLDETKRRLEPFKNPLNLTIMAEQSVLKMTPGWKKHNVIHRFLRYPIRVDKKWNGGRVARRLGIHENWWHMEGWFKQQLLKLCAARYIRTAYFMILDADLCLMHVTDMKTLFPDGRAIITMYRAGEHYAWYEGAAKVLGYPLNVLPDDRAMSVTPELCSTTVVNELMDHLLVRAYKAGFPTLFDLMATMPSWTEYTLYWIYLSKRGEVHDYYTDQTHEPILGTEQSVWVGENLPDIESLRARIEDTARNRKALFLAIQSSCAPVDVCYEAVRPHLA